ncbi:RNA helicase [Pluteus cervinus]|uniref:RNA helicase n=1 Tax=Pluteus cervinus TaxID=181527 RepID=A0ACD3B5A6_9AGAR|nr:RNA helicase [Pluteus cervinus]
MRHQRILAQQGAGSVTAPETPRDIGGHRFCDLCQISVPEWSWSRHCRARPHLAAEDYAKYKATLREVERDKNGIILEGGFDFGVVEPSAARVGHSSTVILKATNPAGQIRLLHADLNSMRKTRNLTMDPGATIQVKVTLQTNYVGRYDDRIEFLFEDLQAKYKFVISRPVRAVVGDRADHQSLRPVAPFVPRPRTRRQREEDVVAGPPLPEASAIQYTTRLLPANIPPHLADVLSKQSQREVVAAVKQDYLPQILSTATYSRHFKTLVWIEEFQADLITSSQDLERYDIHSAKLGRHYDCFHLEVPGLAEKRPSVLVGDSILVQRHDQQNRRWFAGRVFRVEKEIVKLRFAGSFPASSPNQSYTVHFKLNRVPFRRQHQALDTTFSQERVLLPTREHAIDGYRPHTLDIVNPLVVQNPRQLAAVHTIASQRPGSTPFIIFGPPGTGKTMTAVEAIHQVLRTSRSARVLACAPSNSAADLLALRLSALGRDQVFRLYAISRSNSKDQLDHRLVDLTYVTLDGYFSIPPLASLKRFRVIITTCVSASTLYGFGLPRGHFSHIFIDEAGHATEPEAFISIKTLADANTNIILSGDPKQLGPIIRSSVARAFGLETSYLERLMDRDIYQVEVGKTSKTVIKLVKNFRSHPAILKFPNERFYQGELEPTASPHTSNYYLGSSYLPSKHFPIVFYAVHGEDEREASSPSVFNRIEALRVKEYVQALRSDRKFRTADKDIGVIAPYHAQCLKIRNILRPVADGVKVGSVEEFQGQERPVIIISTVRSSKESIEYDLRHTLGFVASPRRFNVAVTRAQSMLIIVGDPHVLSLDPLWRSFLNYIYVNGGWTGPEKISWDPKEPVDDAGRYDKRIRQAIQLNMNDFTKRMEAMTLAGATDEEEELAEVDANVDRPWRDLE